MTNAPQTTKHAPHAAQKKWSLHPSSFILIIGVTALVGYGAGMRNDDIVASVGPVFGFKVQTDKLDVSSLQNTFSELKSNFDGTLDDQKLIDGANRGLVDAAGDIHTSYFDKEAAKEFRDDLSGNIGGGIGAEVGLRNEKPTIIRALKDTPAEKAGVQTGDLILAVNDTAAANLSVDETVKLIRGDIGTTVKLTVQRGTERKELTITRAEINSPSVESRVEGDLGILTISRFDEQTSANSRKAAQSFKDQGVKKVILDLRGNGGGYLSAAPDVAGLWIRDKVIVTEKINGKTQGEQKSGDNALLEGLPTVVLINGGTASASEIVAAALKEYGVATLVGEKSYGKGTVQTLVNLDNDAILKVTIQRWFTPKGNNVDKNGLVPDQAVELKSEDVNANRDPQLDAAKAQLNK